MKTLGCAAVLSGALLIACGSSNDSGTSDTNNETTGSGGSSGETDSTPSCTGIDLDPVTDYAAMGPFATVTETNTGPDGNYTVVRPDPLGQDGFLHPPATWGNGIFTTPEAYPQLLGTIASHGIVVVASNSTNVTPQLMQAGLDWLIAQNDMAGEFQGKLATSCAVSIGYSLGGGAAVETGSDEHVVTTVSFHGLTGASENLHAPLFLLTSTNDGFVTKAGFVQPTYDRSTVVPTLMATFDVPGEAPSNIGHLIPMNMDSVELAPAIAWLRYWVFGDDGARNYFFGDTCTLCMTPWTDIQRKNLDWSQ